MKVQFFTGFDDTLCHEAIVTLPDGLSKDEINTHFNEWRNEVLFNHWDILDETDDAGEKNANQTQKD